MAGITLSGRTLYAGSCQGIEPLDRFAAAKAAGFDRISLFTSDIARAQAAGFGLADIRAAIDAEGLVLAEVEIVGSWLPGQRADTPLLPPDMAAMLLQGNAENICRKAVELGARSVTIADLFGVPFDGPMVAEHFGAVCDVAADHGLHATLEFVPAGCVATVAQAREVLERADRANAGMLVDSWHFFRGGSSLADMAAVPGELIAAWQINDASLTPADPHIFVDMTTRTMPGDGEFDLAGLMQALAATGTGSPGGIEVFGPHFAAWTADQMAQRCAQALDYCMALAGE